MCLQEEWHPRKEQIKTEEYMKSKNKRKNTIVKDYSLEA